MFFFLDNIILGAFVFGGLYFSLVGCSVTSFLTHVILTNKGNYELDNSKDNESSYRRSWLSPSAQWCYIAYRSITDLNNHQYLYSIGYPQPYFYLYLDKI